MGGLYRDWLTRSAEALLREKSQAFCVEVLGGTEVLRVRGDADPSTAMFIGRLLALSLKANVPLCWALSEPQARLLLHHRIPALVSRSATSTADTLQEQAPADVACKSA